MAQALLGLKLAVENAMEKNSGKKPNNTQIANSLRGSEWMSPSGRIKMLLANGQQAIQPTAVGKTKWDPNKKIVSIYDIERYSAECVNPPPNMKSDEWIKAGFPGAKCE